MPKPATESEKKINIHQNGALGVIMWGPPEIDFKAPVLFSYEFQNGSPAASRLVCCRVALLCAARLSTSQFIGAQAGLQIAVFPMVSERFGAKFASQ